MGKPYLNPIAPYFADFGRKGEENGGEWGCLKELAQSGSFLIECGLVRS